MPTEESRVKALLDAKNKSEDTFEKNLTYINAGALGISISLVNTVVPLATAYCRRLIIASWATLLLGLIVNLISHGITSDFTHRKLHEFVSSKNDANKAIENSINEYNKTLKIWNWFTVILLILGLGFMITFCSINIL